MNTVKKRIAVHTLGCKVNQYDSEAMLESFERCGYEGVSFDDAADVYLINTCTVTGTGDQKSMKLIRRTHRMHPQAAIVVAGCLAQRDAELVMMEGVRVVVGVQRRAEVVELTEKAVREDIQINAVSDLKNASFESLFVTRHEGKTRATMKIQEGCDRYCAYCIIPSVRGPVRSMPMAEVRKESARLAAAGYREIVVTGIHLASYGRGTDDTLADAIDCVQANEGVMRVRLGSVEPVVVTEEFASRIAAMPKVSRQFHLSMQSGSAGVLKRMHRRYTPDEYMRAVETLRKYIPDCAITTDVLCGFPGETGEEAQETLDFVRRVAFARIHVFPYSRRKGTVADRMENQVPEEVKHIRAKQLIALGDELEETFVQAQIGTRQAVLFEQECAPGVSEGYTSNYVRVRAKAEPGEWKEVTLTGREGVLAIGEE